MIWKMLTATLVGIATGFAVCATKYAVELLGASSELNVAEYFAASAVGLSVLTCMEVSDLAKKIKDIPRRVPS